MAIQDSSWSLEEMNYTLCLVVVPELEVIPCLLRVLLSVMDTDWTTCVRNVVNRDTKCTIHG